MTQHIKTRISAVMVILFATTALSKAEESEPLTKLKTEKAALERRLTEINVQIDKISVGRGVEFLGMTLVDPTEELTKQYGLSADHPEPIVVKVQGRSFFPDRMAPFEGCAFCIVEHPAYGFLSQKETEKRPILFPKTVRELAAAILSCTATPEEYLKLWDESRKRAETLQDKPAERERMLKIADWKLPEGEVGKYVCRVVYHYPDKKGTMTTWIRMDKADLDQLRELLER